MKKSNRQMSHGTSENEAKPWGGGSFANMPQEAVMKEYPKMPYKEMPGIDDTAGRLASDAKDSEKADRRGMDRGMY